MPLRIRHAVDLRPNLGEESVAGVVAAAFQRGEHGWTTADRARLMSGFATTRWVATLRQSLDQPIQGILADADHAVADAYHVYNLLSDGVAAPAVFVIDARGAIVWSYIGKDANDRLPAAQILLNLP